MNHRSIRRCLVAGVVVSVMLSTAFAQTAPKPAATKAPPRAPAKPVEAETPRVDGIMSKEELRACMVEKHESDREAAALRADQQAFLRDYDAVKAEQADLNRLGEELRTRAAAIRTEEDAIGGRLGELQTLFLNAKSDEEKAALESERQTLLERRRKTEQARRDYDTAQGSYRARVDDLNGRITAINARSKTVNDRVEPVRARIDDWKAKCANRRYREEDEIAIRKELGL